MELQPFHGTPRYELRRALGSGTAGVVYEALDRERGALVALKLLHQTDPASLYRFKQEFRALAHLNHPNLVPLYELQHEDDKWFVTMELIDGVDFIRYARDPAVLARGTAALEERLRPAVRQLAQGIAALHASGTLHRDIKPSNVLVTPGGQVMILDFGLVTKASSKQTFQSYTEDILGTPAYMAPEQGTGGDVSEATDWYAVGALVYEALTGQPPFSGQFVQVMLEKQRRDPKTPRELVPEVSEDLDLLCRDLLRRDPAARPGEVEVLERLGSKEARRHTTLTSMAPDLVGRGEHLAEMWQAFERVQNEAAVVLYVHGASGMGKTALVRQFLNEVREKHPDVVTLSGRCYAHETVPYKAFDNVIDMLTRYLRSLSYREAATLVPRDVLVLARLFPVLKRVKAVTDARRRVLEIPDSHELRRRAFAALRELLTRMAEDRPLVIFIDDLQWGDFDSAVLLSDVMRPPDPPPLLLIGAYRDEDATTSPLLRALRPGAPSDTTVLGEDVEVRELLPRAAEELANQFLSSEEGQTAAAARVIARDSHGNPLFVEELARHVLSQDRESIRASAVSTLDEVLQSRVRELSREARELLEILAVAGRPIELDVARRAADLAAGELAAFTQLRLGNLARSSGARGDDVIEVWNDRVERAVLATLTQPRRMVHHLRLARELEATARCDAETLAHHFAEAGEPERALDYAAEAAEASARALAFNRAARLFREAIRLGSGDEEKKRRLQTRLAEVLVNAGRGAEAAEVFLDLAEEAPKAESLEMRRRAAHFFLVSGHVDQGLATLGDVLTRIGMKLALGPWTTLFGLLLRRALLWLTGYRFQERDATQVTAEELVRIDACWSAAIGLGVVDTFHGAAFQARHLQLALRAGEPYRVARALALDAAYAATAGARTKRRTDRLLFRTAELARRVGDPHTFGLSTLASGFVAYLQGRFQDANEELQRAEEILRDRCTGVTWELDNAQLFYLLTLFYLGEVKDLLRCLPIRLKEARERGDLYALTSTETRVSWIARLAEDDPETGREALSEAIARWSQQGFHLQHAWALIGECEIDLYQGKPGSSLELLEAAWPAMGQSYLLRLRTLAVEVRFLRARGHLSAAAALDTAAERRPHLKAAVQDARWIARAKMDWTVPMARLLEAGAAATRGEEEPALGLVETAERGFLRCDMKLHAAAARRRRGQLAGGDDGRSLVERADREMSGQKIRNPGGFAALLAPGIWD